MLTVSIGDKQREDLILRLVNKGLTRENANTKIEQFMETKLRLVNASDSPQTDAYEPGNTPVVTAVRAALELAAGLPPKCPPSRWSPNIPTYIIDCGFWQKMWVAESPCGGKYQRLGQIIRRATPEEIRVWKSLFCTDNLKG